MVCTLLYLNCSLVSCSHFVCLGCVLSFTYTSAWVFFTVVTVQCVSAVGYFTFKEEISENKSVHNFARLPIGNNKDHYAPPFLGISQHACYYPCQNKLTLKQILHQQC